MSAADRAILTPQQITNTLAFYLKDSFFLPPEVLEAAREQGWMIPSLQVVPAEEFLQAAPLLEEMTAIKYEPSYELVLFATKVGVSIRRHEESGVLHVLVKMWK